jgi:hypothetical protein
LDLVSSRIEYEQSNASTTQPHYCTGSSHQSGEANA